MAPLPPPLAALVSAGREMGGRLPRADEFGEVPNTDRIGKLVAGLALDSPDELDACENCAQVSHPLSYEALPVNAHRSAAGVTLSPTGTCAPRGAAGRANRCA